MRERCRPHHSSASATGPTARAAFRRLSALAVQARRSRRVSGNLSLSLGGEPNGRHGCVLSCSAALSPSTRRPWLRPSLCVLLDAVPQDMMQSMKELNFLPIRLGCLFEFGNSFLQPLNGVFPRPRQSGPQAGFDFRQCGRTHHGSASTESRPTDRAAFRRLSAPAVQARR